MSKAAFFLILALGLVAPPVRAEPAAPAAGAAPLPAVRVLEETAPVTFRDGRSSVLVRIPLPLHRGANAFRLYGPRPLTLRSRGRRTDLYRDAFLELATRSRLQPSGNALDTLLKQAEGLSLPGVTSGTARSGGAGWTSTGVLKHAASLPAYRHFSALTRALGGAELNLDLAEPVLEGLRLRALATDEAEGRLVRMGQLLNVETAGADPALRDGYRAARAEFDQLQQGLWPAITASLRKHQSRLLLRAARDVVLSRLGFWALFGFLGWQGVESAFNAEYQGQYAICLATVAAGLAEAAARHPEHLPLVLYAEYATNYQLTEALKEGQVMELKAAGGRSRPEWQIQFTGRCEELRKALGKVE